MNPYHGQALLEYFPSNYFQLLFEFLFRLNAELQKKVNDFKRAKFGLYTIGIQIRAPTLTEAGQLDHKGFPVPPLPLFAQAAQHLTYLQSSVPPSEVVWYVSTQNTSLIKQLQNSYGQDKIIHFEGKITTTFEIGDEGKKVSLLSWWILGECNDIITTEASSYGTTAAARSGISSVVCTHHKYCFRRLSSTPCQDTPFLVDQPGYEGMECLKKENRTFPHQFLTSPESSCAFYKHHIYISPQYKAEKWDIKE